MGDDDLGDRPLEEIRELERKDHGAAARLEAATGALREVDAARAEAARISAALAAVPAERVHLEAALREARVREAESRVMLADAEQRNDEVGHSRRSGADARAEAERALRRAAVAVADSAATSARLDHEVSELATTEASLVADAAALAATARTVAITVAALPRVSDSGRTNPGETLEQIGTWGSRTHAALFVVCRSLENEREQIVLEANALAAAALGEQVAGSSVALVRRRLERR